MSHVIEVIQIFLKVLCLHIACYIIKLQIELKQTQKTKENLKTRSGRFNIIKLVPIMQTVGRKKCDKLSIEEHFWTR